MNILTTLNNKKNKIKTSVQNRADDRKSKILAKKRDADIKNYSPIFKEDIGKLDLEHENIIRIVDQDPRQEIEACEGSIGFIDRIKETRIKTFYNNYIKDLGLELYPDESPTVYVKDPCIPKKFISIDQYFDYMKQVRVNELTTLAQSLGAKKVIVTISEKSGVHITENIAANAEVGQIVKVKGNLFSRKREAKQMEIVASAEFKKPIIPSKAELPELLYFKKEPDIKALIDMVCGGNSKLQNRDYSFKTSKSTGISINQSAEIITKVNMMNVKGADEFEKSSKIDEKTFFTYHIEF